MNMRWFCTELCIRYYSIIQSVQNSRYVSYSWWLFHWCSLWLFRRRIGIEISLSKINDLKNEVKTRTIRTPAFWDTPRRPMITHHRFSQKWQLRVCKLNFRVCKMPLLMKIPMIHIRSQVERRRQSSNFQKIAKKSNLKFCKILYKWHTFWSCLIRCINMKWRHPEL